MASGGGETSVRLFSARNSLLAAAHDSLSTRWPLCHYCLTHEVDTCPHSLFGFVRIQADTEAGTANAGALDETINKYEQDKSGVSAACASPWVFTAHNNTPNALRPVHFVFASCRLGREDCQFPRLANLSG